jgi:hypothetical protein
MACGLLAGATTAVAGAEEAKVAAFNTQVQVEIAADGQAHATSIDRRLPDALRGPIERQVEKWRFAPPQLNGHAVAATTYVRLTACLVPSEGDAVRLAVAYSGHGPGSDPKPEFLAPRYPVAALRGGVSANLQLQYVVQGDGKTVLEKVDFDSPISSAARRGFEDSARQWLKGQRFKPESIDGTQVATRMQMPMNFSIGTPLSSPSQAEREVQKLHERLLAEQALSPACIAASGQLPSSEGFALDSQIEVDPRG